MTFHRRDVLRGIGGTALLAGLSGCPSGRDGTNTESPVVDQTNTQSPADGQTNTPVPDTGRCESDTACFDYSLERADGALDTLAISHVDGRDLPADEVYVSGVAFDWPPVRRRGYTYPWHQLSESDLAPAAGIADRSVRIHPALVHSIRLLWRHDGEVTLLDEFRVSECDFDVACFEYVHEGADDNPDNLTISHVAGRDLSADEVYVTGTVSEWPPEREEGDTEPWHELSRREPASRPLEPNEGVAGHSVRVHVGLVGTVRVLWRHDGQESILEELPL